MAKLQIISKEGEVAGNIDDGKFKAIAKPLRVLLARYRKQGAPQRTGGATEDKAWDGFEYIKPNDDRFVSTVILALGWEGYRFKEVEPGD